MWQILSNSQDRLHFQMPTYLPVLRVLGVVLWLDATLQCTATQALDWKWQWFLSMGFTNSDWKHPYRQPPSRSAWAQPEQRQCQTSPEVCSKLTLWCILPNMERRNATERQSVKGKLILACLFMLQNTVLALLWADQYLQSERDVFPRKAVSLAREKH